MVDRASLENIKRKRYLFLKKLYDSTSGGTNTTVNIYDTGRALGFSDAETDSIYSYLERSGYVSGVFMDGRGGSIAPTATGINFIEDSLSNSHISESIPISNDTTTPNLSINPMFNGRDAVIEGDLCFVIMPFNEENDIQETYQAVIRPTIGALGYRCLRSDDFYENRPIIDIIWQNILKSSIMIADLTGRNPNVFYELGIAHTLGKEVILLVQNINDIPFDLRHWRIIEYTCTSVGYDKLRENLSQTINTIKNGRR